MWRWCVWVYIEMIDNWLKRWDCMPDFVFFADRWIYQEKKKKSNHQFQRWRRTIQGMLVQGKDRWTKRTSAKCGSLKQGRLIKFLVPQQRDDTSKKDNPWAQILDLLALTRRIKGFHYPSYPETFYSLHKVFSSLCIPIFPLAHQSSNRQRMLQNIWNDSS